MTDQELEARLRALAGAEAPPVPRAGAVEAIVERRARGERIAVPEAVPPRRGMTWWVVGAAAAGLALLWPVAHGVEPTGTGHAPPVAHVDTTLRTDQLGGFLLPAPLAAQATAEPSYRRLEDPIGLRLRPGHWYYTQLGHEGAPAPGDTLTALAMIRGDYQGREAWLFLSGRKLGGAAPEYRDTTWLSRDSLKAYGRVARIGDDLRIEEVWREHEVLIGETHGGYTAWRTRPMHYKTFYTTEGQPVRWYQLLARLTAEPLGPDWTGSLGMPGLVMQGPMYRAFLNLKVFRDEELTVPAGTFDCWKVGLGEERDGLFFWISKDQRWIVAIGASRDGERRPGQVLVEGWSGE